MFCLAAGFAAGLAAYAQTPSGVQNASGMQLVVANDNTCPTLHIILPGHPYSDRTIEVLFPEHVTVRKRGETEGKHLYLFRPGLRGDLPGWRQVGQSLEYEKDFEGDLHMLARATLEDDGVRFRYQFVNRSKTAYEMIYASTDPRLTSLLPRCALGAHLRSPQGRIRSSCGRNAKSADHASRSMAACTLSGFLYMGRPAEESGTER
jgi:hypothetical protein